MESELTTFLTTIDTPKFRRNNMAKVRAKAAAAQPSPGYPLSVPLAVAESRSLPLLRFGVAALVARLLPAQKVGAGIVGGDSLNRPRSRA